MKTGRRKTFLLLSIFTFHPPRCAIPCLKKSGLFSFTLGTQRGVVPRFSHWTEHWTTCARAAYPIHYQFSELLLNNQIKFKTKAFCWSATDRFRRYCRRHRCRVFFFILSCWWERGEHLIKMHPEIDFRVFNICQCSISANKGFSAENGVNRKGGDFSLGELLFCISFS